MLKDNVTVMDGLSESAADLKSVMFRVQSEFEEARKGKLPEALRLWYEISQQYEELDKARKELYAQIEQMSRATLPEMLDESDVKTITLELDGGRKVRFTKNARVSCSMVDKEGGMNWLRESGNEALIQETVNSSTLSAFAKQYIEDEGRDLPPEMFKMSTLNYISATKA